MILATNLFLSGRLRYLKYINCDLLCIWVSLRFISVQSLSKKSTAVGSFLQGRNLDFRWCGQFTCHLERREWVTKILSLEMTIFGLKMMVKSGLEKNILKFHVPLQSCCYPVQKNCPERLNWPDWVASICEGACGISKKKILDHFSTSFLSKNGHFKT